MGNIILPKNHPYAGGRECTTCGIFKSASQFTLTRDKRSFGGVSMRSKCKTCDDVRKYKYNIKRLYGIPYEDYEEIFDRQNGCCAICKSKVSNNKNYRLFVDHCHDTLKIRGLLCQQCNLALGLFKDSPTILKKAIEYLESGKE